MGKKFDIKVKIMDAGTAFYKAKEGFGTQLGNIQAELKEHGRVYRSDDIEGSVPQSCSDIDFFLDFSTIWRNRYITCKLEDSGYSGENTDIGEPVNRYSVVFKEGNSSTVLRGTVFVCSILFCLILPFFKAILTLCSIPLALFLLYMWLKPSEYSQKVVKQLKNTMESKNRQN